MLSPEWVEIISKGGAIVVLIVAWARAEMRADREREKNEALAKDSITQSAKTEATLDKIASILGSGRKNGA